MQPIPAVEKLVHSSLARHTVYINIMVRCLVRRLYILTLSLSSHSCLQHLSRISLTFSHSLSRSVYSLSHSLSHSVSTCVTLSPFLLLTLPSPPRHSSPSLFLPPPHSSLPLTLHLTHTPPFSSSLTSFHMLTVSQSLLVQLSVLFHPIPPSLTPGLTLCFPSVLPSLSHLSVTLIVSAAPCHSLIPSFPNSVISFSRSQLHSYSFSKPPYAGSHSLTSPPPLSLSFPQFPTQWFPSFFGP